MESPGRLVSLDIVRGFAVLGILTMNITLALPGPARLVPTVSGGFSGANFGVWVAGFFLFDEKMITLFSMLFGAGLYLLAQRASGWREIARRQAVLLLIGLFHACLIWEGDILCCYAICGLAVYPLRNLESNRLLALALGLWLVSVALSAGFGRFASNDEGLVKSFRPGDAEIAKLIDENRNATWWRATEKRASEALALQAVAFPTSFFWTISARMLVGIVLLRWGLLSGAWSGGRYGRAALASYAIGFPLVGLAFRGLLGHDFDPGYLFAVGLSTNQAGSIFVAIGHACAILALYRSGTVEWLFDRLAAVGRMALSNYLSQSLIATWFFNGYGLGQFGQWDRVGLMMFVAGIWVLQLWWSPLWLKRFRMGPVEWCWRVATKGGRLPLLRMDAEIRRQT